MIKLKITGIKELERAFKVLPEKVAKKVIRQALRKGLKPILADAKSRVPVDTGFLRDHIKIRAGARTRKLEISALITSGEKGKNLNTGHAYYGAFLEWGTSKRPAQPFMRPAFDAGATAAAKLIEEEITRGIEREAAKLGS